MNKEKIKMELKSLRDEIGQALQLGDDFSKDDFKYLVSTMEDYAQAILDAIEE